MLANVLKRDRIILYSKFIQKLQLLQTEFCHMMRKSIKAMFTLAGIAGITAFFAACSGDAKSETDSFETFYERFHRDADYQMTHVTFPLEGLPSDADAETIASGNFHWQEDEWELQRPFDLENSDFKREFIKFGDDLVVEKIIHQSGEYGTIRRFAKMGEEWYLIYYAGLNRIE